MPPDIVRRDTQPLCHLLEQFLLRRVDRQGKISDEKSHAGIVEAKGSCASDLKRKMARDAKSRAIEVIVVIELRPARGLIAAAAAAAKTAALIVSRLVGRRAARQAEGNI